MKYYQDITLLPDSETDVYFLWQKVYQQLHLGLVEVKDESNQVTLGLSWPHYQYSSSRKHLGNKLRVFAQNEKELHDLNIDKWLARLRDYVHITQIRSVPENIVEYACFKRVNVKSNKERLARRKAKREGISFDKALEQLSMMEEKRVDFPYIKLKSLSHGEFFPLFIQRKIVGDSYSGKWSCYGLSARATVPLF